MSAWDDGTREIDAELEFHLAEATDELVAAGVPREEARERALAQLGDIERWRADCLRQRKGRKTMLVKLQWAAIAALVLALGFLGLRWNRYHQTQSIELESLRAELAAERSTKRVPQSAAEQLSDLHQMAENVRDDALNGRGVLGRLLADSYLEEVRLRNSPADSGDATEQR
jgi:HAMP domain-containing protein